MTLQDVKRDFVADSAIKLFLEKSISGVTIRDVASASGVGEATVYRYFSTRANLIVACAVKLQSEVGTVFLSAEKDETGYEKIARFYGAYCEMFHTHPELYCFLSEFDAFCLSEGATDLEEYQENFDRFRESFFAAYQAGIADGSLREIKEPETFYYATTHAMLSLCKKLATEARIVRQDDAIDPIAEIRTLTELILSAIKA